MNGEMLLTIAVALGMVLVLYFIAIRPNRRRQEQARQLMEQLEPGTKVLTSSGIIGVVRLVNNDNVVLELSPGNEMTILKAAIAQVNYTDPAKKDQDKSDATETAQLPADKTTGAEKATGSVTDSSQPKVDDNTLGQTDK